MHDKQQNRTNMQIKIEREPIACPRPKVSKWGAYYPKRYADWKKATTKDLQHLEPANILVLLFVIKRPKALKKGNRVLHTKKPDLDNMVKAVCDALPYDDSKIHTIFAQKVYACSGEDPHIVLLQGAGYMHNIVHFFQLVLIHLKRCLL